MAVWTTPAQRQTFFALHRQGKSFRAIAAQVGVSREWVRYWVRRQRAGGGPESRYRRAPAGLLSRFERPVRCGVLRLKRDHPRWGPSRIRFHLGQQPALAGLRLPSPASIGRYLHQWARFRRPTYPRQPVGRPHPPSRVHQRWQIDFKLGIRLADGTRVNQHAVWDPVGEACIGAWLYPAAPDKLPKHVPMEEVRATLRAAFGQWQTLPEEVQTDGEATLIGKPNDNFPSRFTLWLVGLGIRHRIIRPGMPTDNAEVERGHRTLYEYAVVGNERASLAQLQRIVAQRVAELVAELPSRAPGCAGQPPRRGASGLVHPPAAVSARGGAGPL